MCAGSEKKRIDLAKAIPRFDDALRLNRKKSKVLRELSCLRKQGASLEEVCLYGKRGGILRTLAQTIPVRDVILNAVAAMAQMEEEGCPPEGIVAHGGTVLHVLEVTHGRESCSTSTIPLLVFLMKFQHRKGVNPPPWWTRHLSDDMRTAHSVHVALEKTSWSVLMSELKNTSRETLDSNINRIVRAMNYLELSVQQIEAVRDVITADLVAGHAWQSYVVDGPKALRETLHYLFRDGGVSLLSRQEKLERLSDAYHFWLTKALGFTIYFRSSSCVLDQYDLVRHWPIELLHLLFSHPLFPAHRRPSALHHRNGLALEKLCQHARTKEVDKLLGPSPDYKLASYAMCVGVAKSFGESLVSAKVGLEYLYSRLAKAGLWDLPTYDTLLAASIQENNVTAFTYLTETARCHQITT